MRIITLTLNPAFDVHCHVADFKAEHEHLATVTSRDAGGKGVNISRALTANGVDISRNGGVVPDAIVYNTDASATGTTAGTTEGADGTASISADTQLMEALKLLS